MIANALLDEGVESTRKAYIVHKYKQRRKSANYKFVINDWNKPDDSYEMSVNREFYENRKIGEPLIFITKPGALGRE